MELSQNCVLIMYTLRISQEGAGTGDNDASWSKDSTSADEENACFSGGFSVASADKKDPHYLLLKDFMDI